MVNIVQILCIYVSKWKIRHVETIIGMEGERIKENGRACEFKYDIFDIL
jgi:hypothetical protein